MNLDIEQIREEQPDPKRHPLHAHSYYEVCLFREGRGTYHIEGNDYPLEPGDLVLIRPQEAHYVEVDPSYPFERILISFGVGLIRTLDPEQTMHRAFLAPQPGTHSLYRAKDFPELAVPLQNMLLTANDRGEVLICLVRFLQRLEKAYAQAAPVSHTPETVEQKIIRLINDNYHLELSLQELCDRFYLSRAQLCRRFKKATGTSVSKYIMLKRLNAAQRLIKEGRKLSDICDLCGFRDYSTFYRAYTHHFGHSPKQTIVHLGSAD